MSSANYTPEPGSLAAVLCEFFRANPIDELTTVEIAVQFKKSSASIPALLTSCVTAQLLARRIDAERVVHWFAGPKLAPPKPRAVPSPIAAATPPTVQAPAHGNTVPVLRAYYERLIDNCTLAIATAQALVTLMDRMEPDTPDAQRATDDDWMNTKRQAQAALDSIRQSNVPLPT